MQRISQIILTNDYESLKENLISEFGVKNLRFFENDDFKVEDAKAVISEAYIAENSTKFIVIKAEKFGDEAQNSLLKILEEPPRNMVFFIVASSKNLLLPTIRSRLMSQNLLEKKEQTRTGTNWQKLDLKTLSEFVDSKIALERTGEFDKFRLKELICVITKECLAQGVKFSEFELSYINKLVVLCELNAKSHAVLLPLLLMISEKK